MFKSRWGVLGLSALVLYCPAAIDAQATASEIGQAINRYSSAQQPLEEFNTSIGSGSVDSPSVSVNPVSQLRDVSPGDWAHEALQSLTEYPTARAFVSGLTGSRLANTPFGQLPTSADQFGFQSSFRISQAFTLSGWVGVTLAHAEKNGIGFQGTVVNQNDNATILNWAVTLAFPDLGKEGSLTGFVLGNPPRVTSNDSGPENNDTPWHLEGFYRYPVTNKISINPGLLVVINPEADNDNDTIYVGTIRTVFKF